MNEKTHGGFTRGPWIVSKRMNCPVVRSNGPDADDICTPDLPRFVVGRMATAEANARFIAIAGTAATEVEDMGFNGLEAVRALPETIKTLENTISALKAAPCSCNEDRDCQRCVSWRQARALLLRLKGGSDG